MEELENVDLFNMDTEGSLSVFDKPTTNLDGIYRPRLEDAKDKKTGFRSVIRLLPNLLENGKMGPLAIEKHIHYGDFKSHGNLAGYYDCGKNFEDNKCDLCTTYWKLKNSKNQADVEKSGLISRQTKYYSYVLVIEDDQKPELVGKILVFPYGYTIKEKINGERNGEITGTPCNPFDLVNGKDFVVIIKEKAGYANYDASSFKDSSPLKLYDEKKARFVEIPVNEGKVEDKAKKKIKDFLLNRDESVNLAKYEAVSWDEETKGKVQDIISILNGQEIATAERKAQSASNDMVESVDDDFEEGDNVEMSEDDFFMDDE